MQKIINKCQHVFLFNYHVCLSLAECRVLLMECTEDISIPLQNLAEVTWSAKVLYAIISGENLKTSMKHMPV